MTKQISASELLEFCKSLRGYKKAEKTLNDIDADLADYACANLAIQYTQKLIADSCRQWFEEHK